jgi:hypothetical protein
MEYGMTLTRLDIHISFLRVGACDDRHENAHSAASQAQERATYA